MDQPRHKPVRRAAVLATSALMAAPLVALAGGTANAALPDSLPLTISNRTDRDIYICVNGKQDIGGQSRWGYLSRGSGWAFVPLPASGPPDTKEPVPADFCTAGPAAGQELTVPIPKGLYSGRIFWSHGTPLTFQISYVPGSGETGLVTPSVTNKDDPNLDTEWDFAEFTYNDGGIWFNRTNVDMFATSSEIAVTDARGTRTKGGLVTSRDAVFNHLTNLGSPWSDLVQYGTDGRRLRALAPALAIERNQQPDRQPLSFAGMERYLDEVWRYYQTHDLSVDVPQWQHPETHEIWPPATFRGRVDGSGQLVLESVSGRLGQRAVIPRPQPFDVFGCGGLLSNNNDQPGAAMARVCAALNRHVLSETTASGEVTTRVDHIGDDSWDAANLYLVRDEQNDYARVLHQHFVGGEVYAFSYDDIGGHDGTLHSGPEDSPTALRLTIDVPVTSADGRIEAETFAGRQGSVSLADAVDTDRGDLVGDLNGGEYLRWDGVRFPAGLTRLDVRFASGALAGGTLSFRLGSPTAAPIATVDVSSTGGWQSWVTRTVTLTGTPPAGDHTLYVTVESSSGEPVANLNWFGFA